jgi:hypothetical protein
VSLLTRSTADGLDYLLLVLGVVGGLGSGVFLPLFAIVFGDFANACEQQRAEACLHAAPQQQAGYHLCAGGSIMRNIDVVDMVPCCVLCSTGILVLF